MCLRSLNTNAVTLLKLCAAASPTAVMGSLPVMLEHVLNLVATPHTLPPIRNLTQVVEKCHDVYSDMEMVTFSVYGVVIYFFTYWF